LTTIDTIEDLLRLVRENEEVRAALRREVLTEELLALPAQFIAMQETQASMQQTQNAILDRQTSMQESLVALQERQNSMLETQNSMLEELREMRRDISALHGMYRQQHEDFGRFRGNYAADAARRNRGEIAQVFARLRGMRNLRVRALDSDERSDMLDEHYDAVTALNLRDRAWQTFDVPDLIAEVTARRSSAPGFYIAIEASYTGDMEDLLRATDHAKILRSATGLDAYPIVAGVRIGPSIRDKVFEDVTHFIRINDEDTALWYQISEAHMEPPDPI
jgi:hypothetical protein